MQQFADYLGNKGHAAEILMEEEKYEGSKARGTFDKACYFAKFKRAAAICFIRTESPF
jgi:hypothetical protein